MRHDTPQPGRQETPAAPWPETRRLTDFQIAHPDPRYAPVTLLEPSTHGYIHLAAEVQPRPLPLSLFLADGRAKADLLARLRELALQLEQHDAVERVTLFDAIAIPPVPRFSAYVRERGDAVHVPRFDLAVLIETTSPTTAPEVQTSPAYQTLMVTLRQHARDLHVMVARNVKRLGDVDETGQGLFLCNYFVADDARVALELWDYLAGWYAVETGLDNSLLLAPLESAPSDYVLINHARWDESLPRFLWQQLSKASFRTYVLANLEAHRVGALPILYRNASHHAAGQASPWKSALSAAALGAGLVWRFARRRRATDGAKAKAAVCPPTDGVVHVNSRSAG